MVVVVEFMICVRKEESLFFITERRFLYGPDKTLYQIWAVHAGVLFNIEEAAKKEDAHSHDRWGSYEENLPPKSVHNKDRCDISNYLKKPNNEGIQTYNCK